MNKPKLADFDLKEENLLTLENENRRIDYLKKLMDKSRSSANIIGYVVGAIAGLILTIISSKYGMEINENSEVSAIAGSIIFILPISFFIVSGITSFIITSYYDKKEENLTAPSILISELNKKHKAFLTACEDYEIWQQKERAFALKISKEYWDSLDPYKFEKEIGVLFNRLGYRTIVTPKSNDGGIDVIAINENGRLAIQCKKYGGKVTVGMVRQLAGSIQVANDKYGGLFEEQQYNGILISSNGFTEPCFVEARRLKIKLLNSSQVAFLTRKIVEEHKKSNPSSI
ncbi:MAG TPA: restriction endonuclease [Bacilli bacterium]|nr:restriction endonuclease [Bacilli bacterium]